MKINKIRTMIICAAVAVSALLSGCGGTASDDSADAGTESGYGVNVSANGNVGDVELVSGDLIAAIEIEGYGTIKAKLFPDAAPVGVENFKLLCDSGYYDGLKIHRVVADFMFQGGSLNGDGTGGEALVNSGSFGVETSDNMRHFYGALCYANAAGENTTQFYIVNNNDPQYLSDYDTDTLLSNAEIYDEYAAIYADYDADAYAEYYAYQADYYRTLAESIGNASDDVVGKYEEVGGTPFLDGNYTVFGQVYEGFDVIESISAVEVEENSTGEVSKPVSDIVIKSITVSVIG